MDSPVLPILSIFTNPWKVIFFYFCVLSLEIILVLAPSIPHFKEFGMPNIQNEMRICQKFIIKSQWQYQVILFFANFVNFLKSIKSYVPAILWISLDRIIVQAPCIRHFKAFSMANLQYGINICQRHHWSRNDYVKSVSVFFETVFIWTLGS